MMFASVDALEGSLRAAGLGLLRAEVLASARPAIAFQRRHGNDANWPIGVSKFGGRPDLPRGFVWPRRPALATAQQIADGLEATRAHVHVMLADMMRTGPEWPGERAVTQADLDALATEYQRKTEALFKPFPLAFVAQFDLTKLSLEAGFDTDFPDSGYLSIFEDPTSGVTPTVPFVFWSDCIREQLARHNVPQELIEFSDTTTAATDLPWCERTQSALLEPYSVLSVPHHWKSRYARSHPLWNKFWQWFMEPQGDFQPAPLSDVPERLSTNFGDHFGGWPHDIQGHPEDDLDRATPGPSSSGPGKTAKTEWRHIFSFGGEHYAEDMLATRTFPSDGNNFIFIQADDLERRRFDRATHTLQFT